MNSVVFGVIVILLIWRCIVLYFKVVYILIVYCLGIVYGFLLLRLYAFVRL